MFVEIPVANYDGDISVRPKTGHKTSTKLIKVNPEHIASIEEVKYEEQEPVEKKLCVITVGQKTYDVLLTQEELEKRLRQEGSESPVGERVGESNEFVGERVNFDKVFSRTPAKFQLVSCELEEKTKKFSLMPDPNWKSVYRVTMRVDDKEAFLLLGKEGWPDE